tara:strand:- start:283 stop:570 length:288 start_codon:yes stop_codon:yes gene_type:complete
MQTLSAEDEYPDFNLFTDANPDKSVNSTSSSYKCRYYNNHIGRELNKKMKLLIVNQDVAGDNITKLTQNVYMYKGATIAAAPPVDGGLRPKVVSS